MSNNPFLRDWKYIQANFWKIHIFFQNFSMYYNTFCTFYFPYFFLLRHSLGQVWTSNNVSECNGMQEYYLGNHSISGISSKNSIISKKKKMYWKHLAIKLFCWKKSNLVYLQSTMNNFRSKTGHLNKMIKNCQIVFFSSKIFAIINLSMVCSTRG